MKRLLSIIVLLLSVSVLALTNVAAAVEYGGVGGKPANPRAGNDRTKSIFIYTLKQGESAADGIRVFNNTDKIRTIGIYPVDSALASGGAFSCAQKVEARKDVGSWIVLDKSSITLQPHTDIVVPFTVTVPTNSSVGEHDGCIAVQDDSQTTKQTGQNGVVLGFRSAIRVAITIPGTIVKKLSILSVSATQNPQNKHNIIVTPTVKNGGNVSLDTQVKTTIQPVVGVGQSSTTGTYPILPQSEASWNFELKRPFWGGWYRATVYATYGANPTSGIGAKDSSRTTIVKSSSIFFASPQPIALLIELLVVGAVLIAVGYYLMRRRSHHHVRRHWTSYTVKEGDTITTVAGKYEVSWKRLASANKLKAPYALQAGEKLKVPPTKKD